MTRLRLAAAMVLVLAFGSARAEGQEWAGHYSYVEDGGKTAAGIAVIVTHEIAVTRADGGYTAEITANGYQTQVQIHAVGSVSGNKLQLRFDKDGDEQMVKGRYKPGALLLELERGGGKRIYTHWGAYTPATRERYRNPGVYFKRD